MLLRRELTSELRLSENTEPDTGQGRAKARQVSDPGTSQGTYGWAGTKASSWRSRGEEDNGGRPVSWGRRGRRKEEERK